MGHILNEATCRRAASALGEQFQLAGYSSNLPPGCIITSTTSVVVYNTNPSGPTNDLNVVKSICMQVGTNSTNTTNNTTNTNNTNSTNNTNNTNNANNTNTTTPAKSPTEAPSGAPTEAPTPAPTREPTPEPTPDATPKPKPTPPEATPRCSTADKWPAIKCIRKCTATDACYLMSCTENCCNACSQHDPEERRLQVANPILVQGPIRKLAHEAPL